MPESEYFAIAKSPDLVKIVITGPESTGKTSLARQLAAWYSEPLVEEWARTYLAQLGRPYGKADLVEIARGQVRLENRLARRARQILVCDTDLLTLKIWSEYRYSDCHPWVLQMLRRRRYDLYFLCGVEVPWEYDPQRENPDDRDALYAIYKRELVQYEKRFVELTGNEATRLSHAVTVVQQLLQ
jgi:NadR type nicotinamide-nucleotide adenylyltransferase